jgi:hypothetical protein
MPEPYLLEETRFIFSGNRTASLEEHALIMRDEPAAAIDRNRDGKRASARAN